MAEVPLISGLQDNGSPSPEKEKTSRQRRTKKDLDSQISRLLEFCAKTLAAKGEIGYSQFQQLLREHQDPSEVEELIRLFPNKAEFDDTCRRIADRSDELGSLFKPLGLPVPKANFSASGLLYVPAREFFFHSDRSEKLRPLADALVAHLHNGEPLLPRKGRLFFGFGATIAAVAERMCQESSLHFTFSTASVELLLSYVVHGAGRHRGDLEFSGDRIDLVHGCSIPREKQENITTSVISFERMDKAGRFYADVAQKHAALEVALRRTKDRIILVGDASKFFDEGSDELPFTLENNLGAKIFLFTDGPLPQGFTPMKSVTLIEVSKPLPMPSPKEVGLDSSQPAHDVEYSVKRTDLGDDLPEGNDHLPRGPHFGKAR